MPFKKGYTPYNKGKNIIHSGSFKKGMPPWNKALTKETDERLNKASIKQSEVRYKLLKEGKLDSRKGKTYEEIYKNDYSKVGFQEGVKHPTFNNWSSFEPYDKSFSNKFKRAIRKRDNHICLKCGVHQEKLSKTLFVHHINYDKKLTLPQNCCSLCNNCHSETNSNRIHWIKFFQSLLSERYGYRYAEDNKIVMEVNNG